MKPKPEATANLSLNNKGYIQNSQDWKEQFTEKYAEQLNVPLGPVQWKIILYPRHYYEKNGLAPMFARIRRDLGYSRKQLIEVFQVERARNICQLAGLPKSLGMIQAHEGNRSFGFGYGVALRRNCSRDGFYPE